jgi:hypothetical protein
MSRMPAVQAIVNRFTVIISAIGVAMLLGTNAASATVTNDGRSSPVLIPNPLPSSVTGDTSQATADPSDPVPSCSIGALAGTLWYSYTPVAGGNIVVNLAAGAGTIPIAGFYIADGSGNLTQQYCTVGGQATFAFNSGQTYLIMVGQYTGCCSPGPFTLTLSPSSPSDTVPPISSPNVSGTLGNTGWYRSDVTVNWNWTDNESGGTGIDTSNCTSSTTSRGEGIMTLTATCKDLAGNLGRASYTVKVDKTPPTISVAAATPPNGRSDWYTSPVTVDFTCADALSGVASCPSPQTLSSDGSAVSSTAQTATDKAGNTSAPSNVVTVKIDKTPPTVTYTGNAGSYTVDQQVQISCTATDATSGIASSTCQNISGAAYSFGLGMHSYSATATDNAGNTSNPVSTNFTVTVTPSTLTVLINRFCTDPSVAASLDQDVGDIAHAPNAGAKAGALRGFTLLVQVQTGKSLTSDQATVLINLANAL